MPTQSPSMEEINRYSEISMLKTMLETVTANK